MQIFQVRSSFKYSADLITVWSSPVKLQRTWPLVDDRQTTSIQPQHPWQPLEVWPSSATRERCWLLVSVKEDSSNPCRRHQGTDTAWANICPLTRQAQVLKPDSAIPWHTVLLISVSRDVIACPKRHPSLESREWHIEGLQHSVVDFVY